jgi:hypothetical protein
MRMCLTHRRWFSLLINTLVEQGDVERARIALAKVAKELPDYNVPHTLAGGSLDLAKASLLCGMVEEGEKINDALVKNSQEYLRYYYSIPVARFVNTSQDAMNCLYTLEQIRKTYETLAEEGVDLSGKAYTDAQNRFIQEESGRVRHTGANPVPKLSSQNGLCTTIDHQHFIQRPIKPYSRC